MLVVFLPIFVADTKMTFVYNFVAPLITVGFRAILMLFFSFVSQKNIPRETFKTRGYFKQELSNKM